MTGLVANNPQIRRLRRLARRRSTRYDQGAYLIEGPVLVGEALEARTPIVAVYYEASDEFAGLVTKLHAAGVPTHEAAPGALNGVTDSVNPRPIIAEAKLRVSTVSNVVAKANEHQRLLLVLVDVRDPGNVGTILRVAAASGVAGVVCAVGTVDPWAPKVARSAAGALEKLPIATGAGIEAVLLELEAAQIPNLATVAQAGTPYFEAPLAGSAAILLGNEAHGLPSEIIDRASQQVTIPMEGDIESLNVAMAASVLCFEAYRQRLGSSSTTKGTPA